MTERLSTSTQTQTCRHTDDTAGVHRQNRQPGLPRETLTVTPATPVGSLPPDVLGTHTASSALTQLPWAPISGMETSTKRGLQP